MNYPSRPLIGGTLVEGAGEALTRVACRLRYGITWVNDHLVSSAEMPHGGMKRSGHGSDMSVYGMEDYTVIRHVCINHV